MWTKRLLVILPLFVIAVLIQSYFWVPTYTEQTKGSPKRLEQYINASIGDAAILNPILSSDSASATLESLIFEGLLDRDQDLKLRPRVAQSWTISEEIYLLLNLEHRMSPQEVIKTLWEKVRGAREGDELGHIQGITLIPAEQRKITRWIKEGAKEKGIQITLLLPPRILLKLDKVCPDIEERLMEILGHDYYHGLKLRDFILTDTTLPEDVIDEIVKTNIPYVEHNPVILFKLRDNVRFHDGQRVTAHDVKFTYESIMDPKNISPRLADFEPVKEVEVLDDLTLKVTYKRLYSPAITTWSMGILPRHILCKEALVKEAVERGMDPERFSIRDSKFNRNPIGCGPFKFVEWKGDQYVRLKRFDHYWEGPPHYSEYIFRIIPDILTQEMEFYSGTIDSYHVQPHQVHRLKDDPRFQSFSGTAFGYTYIGYNLNREPFKDKRVRTALSMAIDVEKIIKYVLYGQGERITGPFPIQTPYYNQEIHPIPYDPKASLELLKQAGWSLGKEGYLEKGGKRLSFTLITNSGNEIRKAILAIVQDCWRQIGVDVRTDLVEWSVFVQEKVGKRDFDAVILGWMMGIEPDLYQIWHSSQIGPFQLNFVGFKNDEADKLIVKIREEYDEKKRIQLCHALHRIIAEEQPYTFLYCSKWTALLDSRIVIKELDQAGNPIYKRITATKTGNYMYDFNKWIKLPERPTFNILG